MKLKIRELNGHWFIDPEDRKGTSFLLQKESREQMNLLGFLGLATWVRGDWVVKEGDFEL